MRNMKSFICGMVTMLLIVCLGSSALATTGKVTRELEYRDISVTLDGQELDLRDAQGRPVEPFMFEGTNYLPVRALAESLGLEVAWDGKTNTVVLTTHSNSETSTEELISVKDGIRFYFTGIAKNSTGGYDIKIRCENDSDYKIFVYPRDFTINGQQVSYSLADHAYTFDCTVDPGRTLDTALSIDGDWFKENSISEIKRFNVRFAGYDTAKSGWDFETGGKTISVS